MSEPFRSTHVDALWSYDIIALDEDTNEVLTYSLEAGAPTGMSITATTGVVSWSPASGDVGTHVFTVRVTDSTSLTDTQTRALIVTATPEVQQFAIYASDSVMLDDGAMVDGHAGAALVGAGTFLGSGWYGPVHVLVDSSVSMTGDVYGDSVALGWGSTIDVVYTDDLKLDDGSRNGSAAFPSMPALSTTSSVSGLSGTLDVPVETTQTLAAGSTYDTIIVREKGCLELEAGTHSARHVTLEPQACLVALGPILLRVNDGIVTDDGAFIGEAAGVNITADDIVIEIHGSNGGAGGPWDTPVPFEGGYLSQTRATILAPNGTLWLGWKSYNWGRFMGMHVYADVDSTTSRETVLSGPFSGPPTILTSAATTVNERATYTYDLDAIDYDPGDVVTYRLISGPSGMTIDASTGVVSWTTSSSDLGPHTVLLHAEDLAGNFAAEAYTLTVLNVNDPPSIDSQPGTTATADQPYTYGVLASDQDPGDTLTYSLDTSPTGMSIDAQTGLVQWTPTTQQTGAHPVVVRVTDAGGLFDTQSFSIDVSNLNMPPVAVADAYRVAENTPRVLSPDVLANDSDPNGDPLTFVLVAAPSFGTLDVSTFTYTSNTGYDGPDAFTYRARDPGGLESADTAVSLTVYGANQTPTCQNHSYSVNEDELLTVASVMGLTVGATDPENDPVSVLLWSPPAHGTLNLGVDGAFTYLPGLDQTSQVTFEFLCHDGEDIAPTPQTVTITIAPLNDAPLADAGPDRTDPLGTMVTLAGGGTDADGDAMTFSWAFTAIPAGSTAVLTDANTLTPTFGTDQLGTYTVQLTVTDASSAVGTDTVVITSAPLNQPPVIAIDPVPGARVGRSFSYATNATDPDLDTLTYALITAPSGMTISASTGDISWTPGAGDLGSNNVTVTATDPGGLSDSRSYVVDVGLDAVPVAVNDAYDVRVGETLAVGAPGVLGNDTDADGDPLTASLVAAPSFGTLTLNGDGSFDYDVLTSSTASISLAFVEKFHASVGLDTLGSPIVARLTDDDGDGDIDQDDIPAIIHSTRSGNRLVAVRGTDGQEIFNVPGVSQFAEVAAGDIDGDGIVEIIAANINRLIAFDHTGAQQWTSDIDTLPSGYGAVAIANLDGVGLPEIVIGASVYSASGALLGDGRDLTGAPECTGTGTFSSLSAVADVDLDGTPEIAAGPCLYRWDGTSLSLVWTRRADFVDGSVAIGNLDDDPYAEIVVSSTRLYILNHDGTTFAPWGAALNVVRSGAPTLADVDGDGQLEIGIATPTSYRVYETDKTLLWSQTTQDASSGYTGSTTFDFDMDGVTEIVYRDEYYLRVYRGTDGTVLLEHPLRSGTASEQPIVADVDGDGHAELVVTGDRLIGGDTYDTGVHVFEGAPEWVPTRSIWNQHSYHVTNVNDDGSIPLVESSNWLTPGLNHYRLNTQAPQDRKDSFTYLANDGLQSSNTATVTVTIRPPNSPPVVVPTFPATAFIGIPYDHPVVVTDPDLGDTATVTLPEAPTGMTLLTSPYRISWTATSSQAGTHMFALRAEDTQGGFTVTPFTVEVRAAQPTTVPNVVGQSEAAAISLVEGAGLVPVAGFASHLTVPQGEVISQSPAGGTSATEADPVSFTVSTGPAQITVPDVTGLTQASASSQLVASSLVVGNVTQAAHATVAAGLVSSQSPSAGIVVDESSTVDLVVSLGLLVPDVVGLGDTAAVAAIYGLGLVAGTLQFVIDAAPAGTIVSQSPVGGTPANPNDAVDLVISLGPIYTTVPIVAGVAQQDGINAIQAVSLVVGQVLTQNSTTVPAGRIIAATPAGGAVAPVGSSVDLLVSLGPPQVTVPDVVGLTTSAASTAVLAVGLGGSITGEAHPTVPSGEVVRQTPAAGTTVAQGTVVAIYASVGPASSTVPDVVALTQSAAATAIAAAGLTDSATSQYDTTVPVGQVISQAPAAGSVVTANSIVAIDVSLGPQPTTVPNVVGQTVTAASSAIAGANLVPATTYAADAATVDTVISQTPAGGASVGEGSTVDIVVSSGPSPSPVPYLTGFLEADAVSRLTTDGFVAGTISQAPSGAIPVGRVVSQSPPGGALRPASSPVDLVVSTGPQLATVPNVVGLAELHAISELTTAGFVAGAIDAAHSYTVALGLVSWQSPSAGLSIGQGAAVDLTISLGPPPDTNPPVVTVDIQPLHLALGQTATVTVGVTGETGPVTTTVHMNGVPQTVTTGTATVTPGVTGVHVIDVVVTDTSSNATSVTAFFSVTVPGDTTPPVVSITSPLEDAVITEPTPVQGTVSDANLLAYSVLIRSASDQNFTTIHTSSVGADRRPRGVRSHAAGERPLYDSVGSGGCEWSDRVRRDYRPSPGKR